MIGDYFKYKDEDGKTIFIAERQIDSVTIDEVKLEIDINTKKKAFQLSFDHQDEFLQIKNQIFSLLAGRHDQNDNSHFRNYDKYRDY